MLEQCAIAMRPLYDTDDYGDDDGDDDVYRHGVMTTTMRTPTMTTMMFCRIADEQVQ